jgi:transcriptional regulator with XRE-family HTH domain
MTQEPMGRQNGAAMRAFREKERISRAEMTRHLGLTHPNSLTNIENNRRPASRRIIRDAASLLHVPIEAITRSGTAEGIAEEPDEAREERPAA